MAVIHKRPGYVKTIRSVYTISLSEAEMLALLSYIKKTDASPETGEYSMTHTEHDIVMDLYSLMIDAVDSKRVDERNNV